MFQWKNVQLSPQDYENYIWNEDEGQARVNNLNITQLQWSQLYQIAQHKSLQNKLIKKSILAYESNIKRLIVQPNSRFPSKELQKLYEKQNIDLRVHLAQLYDQIGILHVRNISTTVEFTISRLLNLEQEFIRIICSQQMQLDQLKQQNLRLQQSKSSQLCVSCFEQVQKNRNKLLFRQVLACDKSSYFLQEVEAQELTEPERIQKQNREATKKQENQYEIQRICYLNSVEEVLKNRQKILKCNSAPLQTLLSEYLTQILQMLEGSKLPFTQKNLREYDRINKSYESIEDMKGLINTQNFYKKVTILLEKPYQNLVDNIERFVKSNQPKMNVKKTTVQTQTIYLAEIDHIKNLEKRANELNYELQALKQSKSKNQTDLIGNLQSLHRIQIRYMQAVNRNKNIQAENKKLEAQINDLKNQLKIAKQDHHSDQNRLIDINQIEKSGLLKEIRLLESKMKSFEGFQSQIKAKKQLQQKQIQTDSSLINQHNLSFNLQCEEILKASQRLYTQRKSQKKSRKRTTLRMQEAKSIKHMPRISNFQSQNQELLLNNFTKSKQNIGLLEVNDTQRTDIRTKSIKIYTLNPLQQLKQQLIHRASARKISSRNKEFQNKTKYQISALKTPTLSPVQDKRKIKKITQNRLKHTYQPSELSNKAKLHQKHAENISNQINRKKYNRQNSIDYDFQSRKSSPNNKNNQTNAYDQGQQSKQYTLKVNQPPITNTKSESQLLDTILDKPQSVNNTKQKEQLSKLLHFSKRNFEFMIQKNIFGMLYDLRLEKSNKVIPKKPEKRANHSKLSAPEQIDNIVDVECTRIGKKCLQIFFSIEEAQKYQKKIGIWEQFDSFIMIDNNFSKYCERIQQYFDNLKSEKPMLYQQSILFLEKPYYFCQQVQGKDYQTRQITIFRESLKMFQLSKNWIKKLFEKLLKLHKLLHKNCNHIQHFLNIIGFK